MSISCTISKTQQLVYQKLQYFNILPVFDPPLLMADGMSELLCSSEKVRLIGLPESCPLSSNMSKWCQNYLLK